MNLVPLAQYECYKCKYAWEHKPGPVTCPKCNHYYVKWVNYKEWRKKYEEWKKEKKTK